MPTLNEAAGQSSGAQAVLDAGIEQQSADQKVSFRRYQKFALQNDGFVFWVATPDVMEVTGSLHYATDRLIDEDQTVGSNQILLTSESEITQFNAITPMMMWIGTWPIPGSPALKIAFSSRGGYYRQANIWHYSGFAVYAALQTQILDSAADLPAGPIVSNSLPIWLVPNSFAPVYPSYLVPDNLAPPYIAAHIESTMALGSFPIVGPWPGNVVPNSGASPLHTLPISQLMRDEVRLILYGFDNSSALAFFQSLIELSITEFMPFGFANSPAPTDMKRVQPEITALAQKKEIAISANYYQAAADAIARRLILSAMVGEIDIVGPGRHAVGFGEGFLANLIASGTGTVSE